MNNLIIKLYNLNSITYIQNKFYFYSKIFHKNIIKYPDLSYVDAHSKVNRIFTLANSYFLEHCNRVYAGASKTHRISNCVFIFSLGASRYQWDA